MMQINRVTDRTVHCHLLSHSKCSVAVSVNQLWAFVLVCGTKCVNRQGKELTRFISKPENL